MAAKGLRSARRIAKATRSDFRRLSPAENAKLGFSPKARHYVLSSTKRLTKATPTISARQYETKRAGELFGLSPEKATEARRHNAISYLSADQRQRVAKAKNTLQEKRIAAQIAENYKARENIPSRSPQPTRHSSRWRPKATDAEWYREFRRRKLAGEYIPDGEWHRFIDYAQKFKDPAVAVLRASPGAMNFIV
jgi:hypothetical protein